MTTASRQESRHFMDGERQITITLDAALWESVQELANRTAGSAKWLSGKGTNWDNLNIWIIGRVSRCPRGTEANQWVRQAIE
jgi:hypothetical protein